MIRVVHPGSGSLFLPILDPGVKKVPDPEPQDTVQVKTDVFIATLRHSDSLGELEATKIV